MKVLTTSRLSDFLFDSAAAQRCACNIVAAQFVPLSLSLKLAEHSRGAAVEGKHGCSLKAA